MKCKHCAIAMYFYFYVLPFMAVGMDHSRLYVTSILYYICFFDNKDD